MKNFFSKQYLIIGIILLLLSSFSYSQNDLQRLTPLADVVIEGKVIHQESFKSEETGYIHTKSTLTIQKIFKDNRGELLNQLTIITRGGTIDGINESWSHNFTLSNGERGVFFLKNNEIFNESYRVIEGINGFISFRNYGTNNLIGYAPNKVYYHLENDVFSPIETITNQRTFVSLNDYEKKLFEHSIGLTSNECVEYKISDIQVTIANSLANTSSYFLEFDIDIRALQNIFDLKKTELKMEYSTSVLGEYIAGNNNITVTLGGDFGNYQLSLFDDASNKVGINVEKIQSLIALEIDNYYKGLYHAIIEVQNFDLNAILQLTVDENFDLKTFKEDGNSSTEISCNEFNKDVNVEINQLVAPIIDTWTSTVTAGTRTLLIIDGDFFGMERFNSEIWFKNANDPSLGDWIKPQSNDYEFWGPSQIRVYVPTYALDAETGTGSNLKYAGTGKFRVVKFDNVVGAQFDEKDLTVTYAVSNTNENLGSQPIFLTSGNNSNGYTIAYTENFKAKTDGPNGTGNKFTTAFEAALNKWCAKTKLNYTIDTDAYPDGAWDILVDIQNVSNNFENQASTLTPTYDSNCFVTIDNGSTNHPETVQADFINSSSTITFWDNPIIALWDAGPISTSTFSVEKISLHELGHAHGILHTNHPVQLMYYKPDVATEITSEAEDASNYIQSHSETHNCQEGPYQRRISCTTGISRLEEDYSIDISSDNDFILIQNPNQIKLTRTILTSVNGTIVIDNGQSRDEEIKLLIPPNISTGIYFLSILFEGKFLTEKISITK